MSSERHRLSLSTIFPALSVATAILLCASSASAEVRVLEDRLEPSGGVFFANNSALILPESHPTLDRLAQLLREDTSLRIEVQVHSDSRGSGDYNLRMSQARAEALVAGLVERGVPAERVIAQGYGETCPIAPGTTAGGRNQNRRIIFFRLDSDRPRPCPIPAPPPPPQPDPADQFPDPRDAERQWQ